MECQILVPVKKHDRIEEIISCLEVLAQPGMKAVFVVAYRPQVSWMQIQLTAMQAGVEATKALQQVVGTASRERQLRWVEEKIRPAYAALRRKDVTVVIQTYTGSA